MFRIRRLRPLLAVLAVLTAVFVVASDVDARVGGGSSSGSRGSRSFSVPPSTSTAPNAARPLERTMTQPGQVSQPGRVSSPGLFGGLFNRPGLLGGLFGGLLGAGLLGMLFGHGLFGGLGGIASIFGLLLQIALVVLVARLIWSWWQRRSMPAYAGGPMLRNVGPSGLGQTSSGGGSGVAGSSPVTIGQEDYDAFEHLLGEIQAAYGAEDLNALRQRATPEMVSYFADDLAKNSSRGAVNRVSDVKLLQGDLAESWREGDVEYASVAMRFSLCDYYVDRASGRVIDGDPNASTEATELWTFRRDRGGGWLLSAIQQT